MSLFNGLNIPTLTKGYFNLLPINTLGGEIESTLEILLKSLILKLTSATFLTVSNFPILCGFITAWISGLFQEKLEPRMMD